MEFPKINEYEYKFLNSMIGDDGVYLEKPVSQLKREFPNENFGEILNNWVRNGLLVKGAHQIGGHDVVKLTFLGFKRKISSYRNYLLLQHFYNPENQDMIFYSPNEFYKAFPPDRQRQIKFYVELLIKYDKLLWISNGKLGPCLDYEMMIETFKKREIFEQNDEFLLGK